MSAPAYPETHIVFIDTEFSELALHTNPDAVFLQVAVLVTDLNLNLVDEDGYEATIHWGPERIAAARASAVPIVQEMHDKNGLWQASAGPMDITGAKPMDVVADELYAYITAHNPKPRTARLAGNSVSADKVYLEHFTPAVSEHLHYRIADISSLAGMAQWWLGTPMFPKAKDHTAMADIRESIAELRYLKAQTFDRVPVHL